MTDIKFNMHRTTFFEMYKTSRPVSLSTGKPLDVSPLAGYSVYIYQGTAGEPVAWADGSPLFHTVRLYLEDDGTWTMEDDDSNYYAPLSYDDIPIQIIKMLRAEEALDD